MPSRRKTSSVKPEPADQPDSVTQPAKADSLEVVASPARPERRSSDLFVVDNSEEEWKVARDARRFAARALDWGGWGRGTRNNDSLPVAGVVGRESGKLRFGICHLSDFVEDVILENCLLTPSWNQDINDKDVKCVCNIIVII